jgi:hypothetical protein
VPIRQGAPRETIAFFFHFAEGTNASGFVAWLAGLMKQDAGTGVMVVCGFDARNNPALWQTSLGLFDYWGCPWIKGEAVIALVKRLRHVGLNRRSKPRSFSGRELAEPIARPKRWPSDSVLGWL